MTPPVLSVLRYGIQHKKNTTEGSTKAKKQRCFFSLHGQPTTVEWGMSSFDFYIWSHRDDRHIWSVSYSPHLLRLRPLCMRERWRCTVVWFHDYIMWSGFLGFRSCVADGSIILGCDAASQGISCPTFRDNVKVKQSHYRSGEAQWVPGGWGFQISRHSAHDGAKVVSPTYRPPLPPGYIPGTHFS